MPILIILLKGVTGSVFLDALTSRYNSSSFHVPGRILTGQAVQYKYRQYGTVRQMNDPLLMNLC